MHKDALISDDGVYRFTLTRTWDEALPVLAIVMLNPSVADAEIDDPTIRRCIGFAKSWGYGGIVVVNLFAFRSTDAYVLIHEPDRIHVPENLGWIERTCRDRDVLVAWGAMGFRYQAHAELVTKLVRRVAKSVACLGVTKDGHPLHPLYVPGDKPRLPFLMGS